MRSKLTGLLALFSVALSGNAAAMNFEVYNPREPKLLIVAEGRIEPGDDRKLHVLVEGLPVAATVAGILLNSPGGNLVEGMRLAATVRNSRIATYASNRCASACFLVFAAGASRVVFDGAEIGVHSASLNGGETVDTQATTMRMARVLRELGIPQAIIGKMVTTPPDSMAWLTRDDLSTIPGIEFLSPSESKATDYEPGSALRTGRRSADQQAIAPATNPTPTGVPDVPPSFSAGRAARQAWEGWFGGLAGEVRDGAGWWAEHRSKAARERVTCENQVGQSTSWVLGCKEARLRLDSIDAARRADPVYRAGWNSL